MNLYWYFAKRGFGPSQGSKFGVAGIILQQLLLKTKFLEEAQKTLLTPQEQKEFLEIFDEKAIIEAFNSESRILVQKNIIPSIKYFWSVSQNKNIKKVIVEYFYFGQRSHNLEKKIKKCQKTGESDISCERRIVYKILEKLDLPFISEGDLRNVLSEIFEKEITYTSPIFIGLKKENREKKIFEVLEMRRGLRKANHLLLAEKTCQEETYTNLKEFKKVFLQDKKKKKKVEEKCEENVVDRYLLPKALSHKKIFWNKLYDFLKEKNKNKNELLRKRFNEVTPALGEALLFFYEYYAPNLIKYGNSWGDFFDQVNSGIRSMEKLHSYQTGLPVEIASVMVGGGVARLGGLVLRRVSLLARFSKKIQTSSLVTANTTASQNVASNVLLLGEISTLYNIPVKGRVYKKLLQVAEQGRITTKKFLEEAGHLLLSAKLAKNVAEVGERLAPFISKIPILKVPSNMALYYALKHSLSHGVYGLKATPRMLSEIAILLGLHTSTKGYRVFMATEYTKQVLITGANFMACYGLLFAIGSGLTRLSLIGDGRTFESSKALTEASIHGAATMVFLNNTGALVQKLTNFIKAGAIFAAEKTIGELSGAFAKFMHMTFFSGETFMRLLVEAKLFTLWEELQQRFPWMFELNFTYYPNEEREENLLAKATMTTFYNLNFVGGISFARMIGHNQESRLIEGIANSLFRKMSIPSTQVRPNIIDLFQTSLIWAKSHFEKMLSSEEKFKIEEYSKRLSIQKNTEVDLFLLAEIKDLIATVYSKYSKSLSREREFTEMEQALLTLQGENQ